MADEILYAAAIDQLHARYHAHQVATGKDERERTVRGPAQDAQASIAGVIGEQRAIATASTSSSAAFRPGSASVEPARCGD